MPFAKAICDLSVHEGKSKIAVVLVLDGDFGCQTRNDRIVRADIQKSLKKKLKWLNAEVVVLDSSALQSMRIGVSAVQHHE